MKKASADTMNFYDVYISNMISEKYGFSKLDSLKKFIKSKTHDLLQNIDTGLLSIGPPGIFDIWEAEIVTGDPRNSIYIRG